MNLALFDFDGTITTREMMRDFMFRAVAPRRLACGKVLLAPWVAGYRCGLVSGVAVRAAVVRFGFAGAALDAVRAHGAAFAAQALPAVLRPEAMARIRWHQRQGDAVAVVSGALDLYLAPWCEAHGLALICSALEHRDGRLTGRYLGAQCVGEEKARRVRALRPRPLRPRLRLRRHPRGPAAAGTGAQPRLSRQAAARRRPDARRQSPTTGSAMKLARPGAWYTRWVAFT